MASITRTHGSRPHPSEDPPPPDISLDVDARSNRAFQANIPAGSRGAQASCAPKQAPDHKPRVLCLNAAQNKDKEMAARLNALCQQPPSADGSSRFSHVTDGELQEWIANGEVNDLTLKVLLEECNSRAINTNQRALSENNALLQQSLRDLESQAMNIRLEKQELEKIQQALKEAEEKEAAAKAQIEKTKKEYAEIEVQNELHRLAVAASQKKVDQVSNDIWLWVKTKEFADSVFNNWPKIALGACVLYVVKKGGEAIFKKATGDNT